MANARRWSKPTRDIRDTDPAAVKRTSGIFLALVGGEAVMDHGSPDGFPQWTLPCPCHEDEGPDAQGPGELTVGQGAEKLYLNCRPHRCSEQTVCDFLGESTDVLFYYTPATPTYCGAAGKTTGKPCRIETTYDPCPHHRPAPLERCGGAKVGGGTCGWDLAAGGPCPHHPPGEVEPTRCGYLIKPDRPCKTVTTYAPCQHHHDKPPKQFCAEPSSDGPCSSDVTHEPCPDHAGSGVPGEAARTTSSPPWGTSVSRSAD